MEQIKFMVVWELQGIPFIYSMVYPHMPDDAARRNALFHCRQAIDLRLANLTAAGYPPENIAVTRVYRVGENVMADVTPRRAAEIERELADYKRQNGLPSNDDLDLYTAAGMFLRPLGDWVAPAHPLP